MKIVITGALGHIGSRLLRDLPLDFPGAEIVLIDNLSTQRFSSLFELPAGCIFRFIEGNIQHMNLIPHFQGAHSVIHLAAITDAAGSFGREAEIEENNFMGTENVAMACITVGARLIAVSSTSVYGTQSSLVSEDCPEADLQPQSPYAVTKLKEERLVSDLCNRSGLRACIFRFGTIFGTSQGMRFHTAINKFCWQAVMGLPITVWRTAMDQYRPYLSLLDASRAVSFVIKNDTFDGRIYNILSRNSTVREIIDCIRIIIPQAQICFVENQIMNQLSYEVSNERFGSQGFIFTGCIQRGVAETISLLRAANLPVLGGGRVADTSP